MWDSPNWNGFTGRLGYSTNPTANEGSGVTTAANSGNAGGGYAWSAALRYNNGPWAAGYSHYSSKSENRQEVIATGANVAAINDLTGDRIWLGYKFAMGLKLGFAYDWSSNDNGAIAVVGSTKQKRGAWYLPVSYSWGPHAIYAQYARAGDTSNDIAIDTGASAWNLGYDYAFSKRTSMGIFYTAAQQQDRRQLQPQVRWREWRHRDWLGCRRHHGPGRGCPPVVHRHDAQLLIDALRQSARLATAAFGRPFFCAMLKFSRPDALQGWKTERSAR